MMIIFLTFNSSLVPLFEGLWSSNPWELELLGFTAQSHHRSCHAGPESLKRDPVHAGPWPGVGRILLYGYTTKRDAPTCSQTRRLTSPRELNLWWILRLRYGGNRTHAGVNPPFHTVCDLNHSANRVYKIGTECSHHMWWEHSVPIIYTRLAKWLRS